MKPFDRLWNTTPKPPVEPEADRRLLPDRRHIPTSPWGAFPPAGHRLRKRRADEHRQFHFVDRFSLAMWAILLTLLLASITDGVLTLRLLEMGGNEFNPLMGHFIDHGAGTFLACKYLLTATGLPLLVIFKNYYLFGTRLRVGYLLPVLAAMYLVLIAYQLTLIRACTTT